jgi:inositol oxygenase
MENLLTLTGTTITLSDTVREFYRLNHTYQTRDFVLNKQAEFLKFDKKEMPVWEAFDFLNQLVDDSDPDTDLDQLQHLLQTSEAIRRDGHPDWMVLTGLLHDMGKVLCLFGEPQWAVVGDTFPVGCSHSDKIVYPEFFAQNPDTANPAYNTKYGVYSPNCGLRNVRCRGDTMSMFSYGERLPAGVGVVYVTLSFILRTTPRARI